MIRRIRLINFMSHRDTVIEPADGLTILTGQNNCGKSAIVAALQIVSGNVTGDFMVRHGERECVVAIETDEGHEVQWRRKGGTVSYRLNGRDVHRLQGSVPDELHELLRLPCVQADGGDFEIHFAEQKNPIFLLNETASRRATFFASSSDAIKLIEMQNRHRRKIQDARVRESNLVARENLLNARLESLSTLETIGDQLGELKARHKLVVDGIHDTGTLQEFVEELVYAYHWCDQWSDTANASRTLTTPPTLSDTRQFSEVVEGIDRIVNQVVVGEDVCAALHELMTPPDAYDVASLSDIIGCLSSTHFEIGLNTELQRHCGKLISPPALENTRELKLLVDELLGSAASTQPLIEQRAALTLLSAPPEVANTSQLMETIRVQESAAQAATNQRTILENLLNLKDHPVLPECEGLLGSIHQITESEQLVNQRELSLQQLHAELADVEHDFHQIAETLETCPICGQRVDGEQLLATSALRSGE